ncbi:phage protein [Salmonella enterica subsp. enterica]|nr:phage protein [Salmonella enterica subsp. enterica]
MTERISGGSFDVNYDSIMIHVENATVTITDNSAVAQSRGIPNGHTKGSVSADVEVEVDSQNFKKFTAVARAAGSWRAIPAKDFLFYANAGDDEEKSRCLAVFRRCPTSSTSTPTRPAKPRRKLNSW